MRYFFAILLLIHGLIHLIGFTKAFQLAPVSQIQLPISKSAGVLWLLSALLFAAAALLYLFRQDYWWLLAAPAVVLSQVLFFFSWSDARFGTVINAIVLAVLIVGIGDWLFKRQTERETRALLEKSVGRRRQIQNADLAALPPVVQHWLIHAGVPGTNEVYRAYLVQKGKMRTKPDGAWMPFSASQYFTADPPGFIWQTEVTVAPMLYLSGRDLWDDNHGNMLIRLWSVFPIADAKGPQTDQGTLVRYLGEICWFPSAALSDKIQWEQLDAFSAKATLREGAVTASGIFHFDADGELLGFDAMRYYDRKTGATLERWVVENKSYGRFNGIRVPTRCSVSWKLADGDFNWLNLEVTQLLYNEQLKP